MTELTIKQKQKMFDDCVQDLLSKSKKALFDHSDTWRRVMPGTVVARVQQEVTCIVAEAVKQAIEDNEEGPQATIVR